jgi:hypothetical protein
VTCVGWFFRTPTSWGRCEISAGLFNPLRAETVVFICTLILHIIKEKSKGDSTVSFDGHDTRSKLFFIRYIYMSRNFKQVMLLIESFLLSAFISYS